MTDAQEVAPLCGVEDEGWASPCIREHGHAGWHEAEGGWSFYPPAPATAGSAAQSVEEAREKYDEATVAADEAAKHSPSDEVIDGALDAADAAYIALEQAIIRSHHDVVALVQAARRTAGWFYGKSNDARADELVNALAPWPEDTTNG